MGDFTTTTKGRYGKHKGTIGQRERVKDARKDTYLEREKWREPTKCTECGAVYIDGRWTWQPPSRDAEEVTCPACRRIADEYPAGIVEIRGDFLHSHRSEVINLLRNVEAAEKAEHPLERIMAVNSDESGLHVTTTGLHLARRFGAALESAYKGELSIHYAENEQRVRVCWER